jgi:hypothetical protein
MSAVIFGIGAIAATIASPFLFRSWTHWWGKRKLLTHGNLLGTWRSTWQTNASVGNEWVTENVNVDVAKSLLRFANDNNSSHYQWTGEARVVGDSYVCGTWQSKVKPASRGTFILALTDTAATKHGDALVGFFLGPNDDGFANYGAWAMARHTGDLSNAKKRLRVAGPTLNEIYGP